MPDTYDAATRSEVMKRVKGRDTTPEVQLRRALHALGARGWRCHRRDMPGKPDVAFGKGKLAVFVDGAFWHGHPAKYWRGRSGAYWDKKIERNIARDHETNGRLVELGWNVVRLWDYQVESDPLAAAETVILALERARRGETVIEVHDVAALAEGPPGTTS